jgi:Nuclease A inhibitor-like protein
VNKPEFEQLVEGLLFMSETDAPLTYYEIAGEAAQHWPPATAVQFLELVGEDQNKLVQPIDPEEFFRKLRPGNEERADQIEALRKAILEELENVRCYRVGEIRIDIYVLGRDDSKVCGLQTLSVET